jgi:hypothetical protein
MKRFSLPAIALLFMGIIFTFFSCGSPHSNPKKKFDVRLNKFNRSLQKADKTMDMMDDRESRKAKVQEDYRKGEITKAVAQKRLSAIDNQYNRKVAVSSGNVHGSGLPGWAKALGLTEPKNMVIDKSLSQVTNEDKREGGFNSLTLVYKGSYKQAMEQAEKVAAKAGIPLTPEYKTAMEMKRKYGDDILKGAVYMNFELGAKNNPKYNIAITVDEKGVLTISATDAEKMDREMKALNPGK